VYHFAILSFHARAHSPFSHDQDVTWRHCIEWCTPFITRLFTWSRPCSAIHVTQTNGVKTLFSSATYAFPLSLAVGKTGAAWVLRGGGPPRLEPRRPWLVAWPPPPMGAWLRCMVAEEVGGHQCTDHRHPSMATVCWLVCSCPSIYYKNCNSISELWAADEVNIRTNKSDISYLKPAGPSTFWSTQASQTLLVSDSLGTGCSTALRKYKAQEDSDYTAMNAVVHWHLGAETRAHPGGKVVSTVIILSSLWLLLLARLKQHGHHVTCINWNELLTSCLHCAGILWTRSEYELVDASTESA